MGDEDMNNSEDILRLGNISLWINSYDDIFSDFDSRPYSERALSDDFLVEMKRASRDKPSGVIELKFMISRDKRNLSHEALIRRRLKEHFKKHHVLMHREHKKIRNRGIFLILLGILMITFASYVSTFELNSFLLNFLLIILEPGGWFLGWTGCDQLFYNLREHKDELDFHEKMAGIEVQFISIQTN